MGEKRCGAGNCERFVETKGYCQKHYLRWWKHGDPNKVLRIRGTPPVKLKCPGCNKEFKLAASVYRKQVKRGVVEFHCSIKCRGKNKSTPDVDRFWVKVKKSRGCWIWKAATDKDGYGIFSHNSFGETKAHRVAYRLVVGEIDDDVMICHSCDTPSCVNPKHLWPGTNKDNQSDMARKGRYGNRPCQPGERNIKAKLVTADVKNIRRRVASGEAAAALALEFGISASHVRAVYTRKTWKHVR